MRYLVRVRVTLMWPFSYLTIPSTRSPLSSFDSGFPQSWARVKKIPPLILRRPPPGVQKELLKPRLKPSVLPSTAWPQSTTRTHKIDGTGISTYIWLIFMVNVGKYTSSMDPMGNIESNIDIIQKTNTQFVISQSGKEMHLPNHFYGMWLSCKEKKTLFFWNIIWLLSTILEHFITEFH